MLKAVKFAAVLVILVSMPALAEMNGTLRIGVLNDMSRVYADFQGPGSVLAAQMAVEDFAKQSNRKVEVMSGDHQNKPDIGAGIARRWLDVEGVDMIIDFPIRLWRLRSAKSCVRKTKSPLAPAPALRRLLDSNVRQFRALDLRHLGIRARHSPGVLAQGGKSWFFVTADYAFGQDLEKQARDEVNSSGGKVLGSVRHPIATNDFSSFLLQAQASQADVIALANAGGDTVNAIEQAADFKLGESKRSSRLFLTCSRPCSRPADSPGFAGDQCVVLGPRRSDARLVEALPGAASQENDAKPHAGGRVLGRAALS